MNKIFNFDEINKIIFWMDGTSLKRFCLLIFINLMNFLRFWGSNVISTVMAIQKTKSLCI